MDKYMIRLMKGLYNQQGPSCFENCPVRNNCIAKRSFEPFRTYCMDLRDWLDDQEKKISTHELTEDEELSLGIC